MRGAVVKRRNPGAAYAGKLLEGVTSRSWTGCSSAGQRTKVDSSPDWDEFLLLASLQRQQTTFEPLPNFGESAPHVI